MNRIPSLDGFRAISIMLVLFCHSRVSAGFPVALKDIARQGEVGVTVFFVISGFLITDLLLNEEAKTGTINIRAFYMRRALRILPVYLLYILFILLWRNIEQIETTKANLIHVLTFTVNFDPNRNWFLGHFWSLSVEEQFYLFWPAVLLLFRKNLKIILMLLLVSSSVARIVSHKFLYLEMVTLCPFFKYSGAIFIGSFAGILLNENPAIFKRKIFRSFLAQIAALVLFLTFTYFTEHGVLALISLPFGDIIISISVLFLIVAYVTPSDSAVFKALNHKAVVHIGVLSYSIYIWQQFFFTGQISGLFRTFPFNIIIIYLVAVASYYLWERQFLKLKKYFSSNKLQSVS